MRNRPQNPFPRNAIGHTGVAPAGSQNLAVQTTPVKVELSFTSGEKKDKESFVVEERPKGCELQARVNGPLQMVLHYHRIPVDFDSEPAVVVFCHQKQIPIVHVLGFTYMANPHWKDAIVRLFITIRALAKCIQRLSLERDIKLLDVYGCARVASLIGRINDRVTCGPKIQLTTFRPIITSADHTRLVAGSVRDLPNVDLFDIVLMNDIYQTEFGRLGPEVLRRVTPEKGLTLWLGYIHHGIAGLQGEEGVWYRRDSEVVCFPDMENLPYVMPSQEWWLASDSAPGISWVVDPVAGFSLMTCVVVKGSSLITHYELPVAAVERKTLPVPRSGFDVFDWRTTLMTFLPWHVATVYMHTSTVAKVASKMAGANVTMYQANRLLGLVETTMAEDALCTRLGVKNPQLLEKIMHGTRVSAYVALIRSRSAFFHSARGVGDLLARTEDDSKDLSVALASSKRRFASLILLVSLAFVSCRRWSRIFAWRILIGIIKISLRILKRAIVGKPIFGLLGFGALFCTGKFLNMNRNSRQETTRLGQEIMTNCAIDSNYQDVQVGSVVHVGVLSVPKREVIQQEIIPRPDAIKAWARCDTFTLGGSKGAKVYLKITGFEYPFYMPLNSPNNTMCMIDRAVRCPPMLPREQAISWRKRIRLDELLCPAPFQPHPIPMSEAIRHAWILTARDAGKRKLYLRAEIDLQRTPMQPNDHRLCEFKLQPKLNELQFGDKHSVRSIMNVGPIASIWLGPWIAEAMIRLKADWREICRLGGIPLGRTRQWRFYPTCGSGLVADALSEWANEADARGPGSVSVIAAGDDVAVIICDLQGKKHYMESDFSMYDQSQSFCELPSNGGGVEPHGPLANSTRALARLGVDPEICRDCLLIYRGSYVVRSPTHEHEVLRIVMRATPIMPSGAMTTTISNTYNTVFMWMVIVDELFTHPTQMPDESAIVHRFALLGMKIKLQIRPTLAQLTFLKGIFIPAVVQTEGGVVQEYVWGVLPGVAMKFGYAKTNPSSIFSNVFKMFGKEAADIRFCRDVANTWRDAVQTPVIRALVVKWADNSPLTIRRQEKVYRDPLTTKNIVSMDFGGIYARYVSTESEFLSLELLIANCGLGDVVRHPLLSRLALDYGEGVDIP